MNRSSLPFPFVCSLALLLLVVSSAASVESRWVGAWMSSQQLCEDKNRPPAPGFAGATLRQVVRLSLGGACLRIHISNAFGDAPLTVDSAQVAVSLGDGAICPESSRAVLFHGRPVITIPPGALAVSDPVDLPVVAQADLAVTFHLPAVPAAITSHPGSRTTSYLRPGADTTAATMTDAVRVDHWYYLSSIEVAPAPAVAAAVVALGDSITDGRGTTTNQNTRWPDNLVRRLQADPQLRGVAVLNAGIGGNRMLGDGLGPGALARFERDVLVPTGVRWLIVLEGVNDLGSRGADRKPSAEDLIVAYEQMIRRAHARGIRVYGATITPLGGSFYDQPGNEEDRQAVNRWIREGGGFDAVIDFDAALRDPAQPARLRAEADSGDHLHPNDEGYRLMAEAVDLRLFAAPLK